MKRVKKNQYSNKYTRKDGRNENMVVGFNIICSLRDWPESPDFPDSTKRPVAPDA